MDINNLQSKPFSELENGILDFWADNDFYSANPKSDKKPFCIMMPPPNITGSLHAGHALNNGLIDFIVRYKRMDGFDVLWQPGTDHASIATQMMVERDLSKRGINPKSLTNDELLNHAWEWKEKYGNTIVSQLKRLGYSADWKRERFTMDPELSSAVQKVFIKLYNDGLIYRDTRLVNWCPKQKTAVSDLEVISREEKGKFYYIKYPLVDGGFIELATTRPETLFGDTAIAVHPESQKYGHLIGKMAMIPLTDRIIPIIGDEHADPDKGTGAVKITPAHDFNDFEVGRRHNLPMINILTADAKLNENVPEKYRGMDRFDARKSVVSDLSESGLLIKTDDHLMQVPYSERGDVVIEPYMTEQWYVRAETLAKRAIDVAENGEISFLPAHRKNLYMAWMSDIRPWCISRQLWWGHKIPAWYDEAGNIYVAENESDAVKQSGGKKLIQDNDVLDTWFSSALWPFATLGWPRDTAELMRYYPTDILITAPDIIFFWVARMVMMGCYIMNDIPFKTAYFHGLVRDASGQKFSKTKGNGVDPIDVVNKYGADAMRYWISTAPIGTDLRYNEEDVKKGSKFINKLWNVTKFVLMNLSDFDPKTATEINVSDRNLMDRWALSEMNQTIRDVRKHLDSYDTFNARESMDKFFWQIFCDQYTEYVKERFWQVERFGNESKLSAQWTLFEILQNIIKMYAIFIPFVTEEIYQKTFAEFDDSKSIHISAYPAESMDLDTNVDDMKIALSILKAVRQLRTEKQIGATAKLKSITIDGKIPESLNDIILMAARSNEIIFGNASTSVENIDLKIDIVPSEVK